MQIVALQMLLSINYLVYDASTDSKVVFRTKNLFEFIYDPREGIYRFIKGWIMG
ncbi:MAG: hypothetical protein LBF68_02490 [Christensenellaceae bacterium]|nr:hypothetical protein [Christensenellaceae bacterium]